jgi:hypothetical protein
MAEEYRAQLAADREKRLSKGLNHADLKEELSSKKRTACPFIRQCCCTPCWVAHRRCMPFRKAQAQGEEGQEGEEGKAEEG